MKTLLILLVVLALTSCKKDYVCECSMQTTITYNGNVVDSYTSSKSKPLGKTSKKVAKEQCKNETVTEESNGMYRDNISTCSLK